MSVRIACAQYAIGAPARFADFVDRVAAEVAVAAGQGAQIAILPEYLALEAAAAFEPAVRADFAASLRALQPLHEGYLDAMRTLARRHDLHLVAGSFLLDVGGGRYRNRSYLIAPDGRSVFQDKLTLTGFEKDTGIIEPGDRLKVFDTPFGRLGIAICYDIEFPLYARAQAEAGARLLLVPSCTDTEAGAHRVRYGCQARAMENQLFVACAVTAGEAAWSPALDTNTGRAAIYGPVDRGFPDDGVQVRAGECDGWAVAEVDPDALEALRRRGQVGIAADWPAQQRPAVERASVESL